MRKAQSEHTTIAHQWRTRLSKTHWTLWALRRKWHSGRKQTCEQNKNHYFNFLLYYPVGVTVLCTYELIR